MWCSGQTWFPSQPCKGRSKSTGEGPLTQVMQFSLINKEVEPGFDARSTGYKTHLLSCEIVGNFLEHNTHFPTLTIEGLCLISWPQGRGCSSIVKVREAVAEDSSWPRTEHPSRLFCILSVSTCFAVCGPKVTSLIHASNMQPRM